MEALEVIADTRPHLVIVDLALKDSDGLDLIKDIRLRWPRLPVLVVSMHEDVLFVERALRSGASGYVTKREATRTLVSAIRRVLGGEIHLNDAVAAQIASHVVGATRPRAGLAVENARNLRPVAPGPQHGGHLSCPPQGQTRPRQRRRAAARRHWLDPRQRLPLNAVSV